MKDFKNWRTDTVEMFLRCLDKFDETDESRAAFSDTFLWFMIKLERLEK